MLLLYRLLFQALIIVARIENLNSLTTFFISSSAIPFSIAQQHDSVCTYVVTIRENILSRNSNGCNDLYEICYFFK